MCLCECECTQPGWKHLLSQSVAPSVNLPRKEVEGVDVLWLETAPRVRRSTTPRTVDHITKRRSVGEKKVRTHPHVRHGSKMHSSVANTGTITVHDVMATPETAVSDSGARKSGRSHGTPPLLRPHPHPLAVLPLPLPPRPPIPRRAIKSHGTTVVDVRRTGTTHPRHRRLPRVVTHHALARTARQRRSLAVVVGMVAARLCRPHFARAEPSFRWTKR